MAKLGESKMKKTLMRMLTILLLTSAPNLAFASMINVTFVGQASGIKLDGQSRLIHFSAPFSAGYTFDTDRGALQTLSPGNHRLDGGMTLAAIDLGSLGTWSLGSSPFDYMVWQDDFSSVMAIAGVGYFHIGMSYIPNVSSSGGFQFGNCPTFIGGPCGFASISSVSGSAAPLPIAGAGIPGLIVVVGLLALRRSKQSKFPLTKSFQK